MKCIKCGHQMQTVKALAMDAEVRGEEVLVHVDAMQCRHCQRTLLDRKGRRAYARAAADAYRQRHKLLTTADFLEMRQNLGMTWKQFADYVPVGVATLKRWLGGEIQSPPMDMLVRLRADASFAQRAADELFMRLATATVDQGASIRVPVKIEWATDSMLADAA
jgi:putative zinc finger/helix-turn-helix YgiT family protein